MSLAVAAVTACAGKPGGSFPIGPSPQDGLAIRYLGDMSCDRFPVSQADERQLTYDLVTLASWHEGSFGEAPIRNDAVQNLNFDEVRFASQMQSPEAIRRDLQAQRNAVSITGLLHYMKAGRRGACQSDLLAAFGELQRNLSGTAVGASPVVVVVATNGIVVGRGLDFYKRQPAPQILVARLKREGLVPRLPGVELFLVGIARVAAPYTERVSLEKSRWLEKFWLDYARAADAKPVLVTSVGDLITRLGGAW